MQHHSKVLILGTGPAGCSAAIYAARANLSTHIVRGLQPGGQMTITTDVENYPGFSEIVQGPELMHQFEEQTRRTGAKLFDDVIVDVDLTSRPFRCYGDSGAQYAGDTLIVATGAAARWLGLETETRFRGFGVSACATCDGFFFRGKRVAVIGGGNSAVEEALFLTRFASRVYLVHRRDQLRAEAILQDRLRAEKKIIPIWNHVVETIIGETEPMPHVTGLDLRHESGDRKRLDLEGVFVAIGHDPNTALFRGQLDCDDDGYIITAPGTTTTNRAGVFAAGDVQDKIYRQAVTAAGSGCMAGLDAARFLST